MSQEKLRSRCLMAIIRANEAYLRYFKSDYKDLCALKWFKRWDTLADIYGEACA